MKTKLAHFDAAPSWDTIAYEAILQEQPPVSIRWNKHKQYHNDININPVPWLEQGLYLPARPSFTLDPLFHAGAYYVQEASSMFIGWLYQQTALANAEQGLKVLDLCAAPGGKSTLIANLLKPDDLLISNEVIQTRNQILIENLARWGQANTWVTQNDPKDFEALPEYFDMMLVDAPCSGSGLWRKDAEAVNEWSPEHVKMCAQRQKRILADVWAALKPGGYLIYSTCSFSPEENEEIADWVMSSFDVESVAPSVPSHWNIVTTQSKQHQATGFRFYPWKVNGEGFFAAMFRKNKTLSSDGNKKVYKSSKKEIKTTSLASANIEKYLADFFLQKMKFIPHHEVYSAILPAHVDDYHYLQKKIRLKKTGTQVGSIKQNQLIPDQELAWSIHLKNPFTEVEVELNEALHYLKKEEIAIGNPPKGWCLIKHKNIALGWAKWLGNRMNNYYPKQSRIRMSI